VTPEGPEGEPWLQHLEPDFVDTADFASDEDGDWKLCFSNAGVNNPWRVVGFNTMEHEVQIQQEAGLVSELVHVDAEGNDEKQISDMQDLLGQDCDAWIVAPNTTEALTPAVEQACEADIPVIVFDRGVNTDCPVTFIKPIGGYAYGADAAEFLVENIPPGGKVVALRILPGVDVLETRFLAAQAIFSQNDIGILQSEFTEGDPSNTKQIISDILGSGERIDGVWMDAGATSVGAIEAFEDAGLPVPPITGEDQNDFLLKWQADDLTAVAPTYPTYQWRTPILAAVMILQGEQVPKNWNLPQPKITAETLDQYADPDMPPLFYPLCGCQGMPGFPEDWQQ
jgi:ribose transport system substrate-binding protein